MSWFIPVLLVCVMVLGGANITLAVVTRRRWMPIVRQWLKQARQTWLRWPKLKAQKSSLHRQSETGPFADIRELWAKINETKVFLEPKTQGIQLTPLALMLELQALERGLQHLAMEQRVGVSDVRYYGRWMKTLEKSVRSFSWLATIQPTPQEKQLREQTHALLIRLKMRLEQLGVPAQRDSEYIVITGAIVLLVTQNQDAKVSAAMCQDYARFIDRKVQQLETKYLNPMTPSMQTRPMQPSAPAPVLPNKPPLVQRPVLGASPTPPPQRPSTSAPMPVAQVPEMPRSETTEQPPLVRRLSNPEQPRVLRQGEASSTDRVTQVPPVSRQYPPRTTSL